MAATSTISPTFQKLCRRAIVYSSLGKPKSTIQGRQQTRSVSVNGLHSADGKWTPECRNAATRSFITGGKYGKEALDAVTTTVIGSFAKVQAYVYLPSHVILLCKFISVRRSSASFVVCAVVSYKVKLETFVFLRVKKKKKKKKCLFLRWWWLFLRLRGFLGRRFDHSLFVLFFKVEISSRTLIPLLRPG